jgi:hypothetical protein
VPFWQRWTNRSPGSSDLDRELRDHLELETADQQQAGLSRDEAILCIPENRIPTEAPTWSTEPEAATLTLGDLQVSIEALWDLRRVHDLHLPTKHGEGGG